LQFQPEGSDADKIVETAGAPTALPSPENSSDVADDKPAEKPAAPGEVVSLDAFRKK
jgi:hypothetical protein